MTNPQIHLKILSILPILLAFGTSNIQAQVKTIHLGDTAVVVERLTFSEASERYADGIKSAVTEGIVPDDGWSHDYDKKSYKILQKEYEKLLAGLRKNGLEVHELSQKKFTEHLQSGNGKSVFLAVDYTVMPDKRYLIIKMSFKLFTTDKEIRIDESSKVILKQVYP